MDVNGFHFKDGYADIEVGEHSWGDANVEHETFLIHGNLTQIHGKHSESIYKDDSNSIYHDTSLGSKVFSSLIKTQINKFMGIQKLFILAILFSFSFFIIFALFQSLPKINNIEVEVDYGKVYHDNDAETKMELLLKLPKTLKDLKLMRQILEVYAKEHRRKMQVMIMCLYLFLQTFTIPGSIFINILAGSLYGFYEALILVLMLVGVGSTMCYCLSHYILREIVYYCFPERCQWMAREVHRHCHHMMKYILFIRLTPILPNWFINVASPIVGVPYGDFIIGTVVGLIPASIVGIKIGGILSKINYLSDLYDFWSIITISFMAILVMLPIIINNRYEWIRGPTTIKII